MNIQPPISMNFHPTTPEKVAQAREGICPQCRPPVEGRPAKTLETKHTCESIEFKQCARCLVVVALERP